MGKLNYNSINWNNTCFVYSKKVFIHIYCFQLKVMKRLFFSNLTIIIKYLNASVWNTYLKVLDQFWNMTSLCSIFFDNDRSRVFLYNISHFLYMYTAYVNLPWYSIVFLEKVWKYRQLKSEFYGVIIRKMDS